MNKFVFKIGLAVLVATILPATGRPEVGFWPLKEQVEFCDLIVKCKLEVNDRTVKYRLVETWKGKCSRDLFYENMDVGIGRPPEGYVKVRVFRTNESLPPSGKEVILFYSVANQPTWAHGKLSGASAVFEVVAGKIVYPNRSIPPRPALGARKDYATEAAFNQAKQLQEAWDVQYGHTHRQEFTVEEFKQAVLAAAGKNGDPTRTKEPVPKRE